MTTELTLFYTQHIPSASGLAPDRIRTWQGTLTISPLWTIIRVSCGARHITRILPPETELPVIEILLHEWLTGDPD